jgi:hypothetical protein
LSGNKSDRQDARKLAELLRSNLLWSVYLEDTGIRTVKELARRYMTIARDLTWVIVRLTALYRNWAIPCAGQQVYAPRRRGEWLEKIAEAGVRRRAELYYQQFDTCCFCTSKCADSAQNWVGTLLLYSIQERRSRVW